MANSHSASTRKRGPQPSNLSVRLFLLDPENKITKVTKQTCSKESIQKLKQKGYGPPPPEHCTTDDKVEFPIALTNEQFKEKLVKIYPNLENSCFVLMKADKNNQLEELNPGTCCFRCYTPENVYHSERGQGRIYIQKIAESEISKCTHGVSLSKRLCPVPGYNQQPLIPIQPKQSSPAVSTFTGVFTSTNLNMIQSVALPGNNVFSAISRPVIFNLVPASALPTQGLSSTTLNHTSGNTMPQEHTATVNSTVNMAAHSSLSSTVVSQTTSSPQVQNSVHVRQENPLLPSSVLSPTENSPQFDEMLRTPPWPPTPRTPNPISTENTVTLDQTSAPSVSMTSQNLLPSTNIVSQAESNPIRPSAVNMVTQESPFQTPPNVTPPAVQYPVNRASQNLSSPLTHLVARNTATPQLTSFVDMVTQNQQQAPTTSAPQTVSRSGAENIYRQPQSELPTVFSVSTASVCSGVNAQFPCIPTSIAVNASTPAFQGMLNMPIQSQLPYSSNGAVARQGQFPRNVCARLPELPRSSELINPLLDQSSTSIPFTNNIEQDLTQMRASFELRRQRPIDRSSNTSMLQAARTGFRAPNAIIGMRDPVMVSSSSMTSLSNPPACFSYGCVQSPGLAALADAAIDTEQREQREEYVTSDANIPNVQEIQELTTQNELSIDSFVENVESTGKLEMSLALLDNHDLMEKLNASIINVSTVEIESTCKLQQALTKFFLPSCLTDLIIKNNNLNDDDIFALSTSLRSVNELRELNLSGTTFTQRSFSFFTGVLVSCNNLTKLCLVDNRLTKLDINCLIPAIESMKNLVNLNLSKNNLTETQARDILQKQEGKSTVSLDLSQNAIRGNEITVGICHLQSLEYLDLSHNQISFFPLPKLERERNLLPPNIKIISLSSNHMTPDDVGSFSALLIRSDLLKLNLDYNNVGNSIWSLCPLRIRHLKVLGLASAAICGPAVQGLAVLLSLTEELEELNLSSNNLVLADLQQICLPLANSTQLKKLNLSNNPDGILSGLCEILPSLKNLEELRLSKVHLNGDDCIKFCKSLASLKGQLRYLDISKNAIGRNGTKALASALMEFLLLEGLDMSKSCIKEDEISVLCKGLVHLNRLKYLNLSGNRIDVEVMCDTVFLPPMIEELILSDVIHGQKLFASMTTLQHLRIIHLSGMRLRPCDVKALTAMLTSFPLLEHLVLSNVVCAECDEIFSAIKSLKNMKKIDLTGIQIRGGNIFAEMLLSLLSLEELVLANINVVDSEYNAIFNAIKSLRNLKRLDLTGTKNPDVNAFAEMLSSLLPLEELVLANIHIHPDVKSQKRIFSKIKFLKSLRRLNLGSNMGIREDFDKALLSMLSSLRFLEDIVFPRIYLYGDANTEFFSAITSLKNLKSLDLENISGNKCITKNLAYTLPSLQWLEKLRFTPCNDSDCHDDDDDYEEHQSEFFRALVNLRYLQELHLDGNFIRETGMEALTEVLPSLHSLEKLSLRIADFDDECERQLFAAIRNLGWLKELALIVDPDFGTKLVTGSLGEALISLQLLEKLTFDGLFHDSEDEKLFVAALRSLKYLKELYLDIGLDNQIEGTLAEVLPSLKLLENLVLKSCMVLKQVPAALGLLKYLKKLKLSLFDIAEDSAESLAEVLPSLQFLESLVFRSVDFQNGNKKQVFVALRSLKYLKKLKLRCYGIAKDSAETLAEVLSSLQLLEELTLRELDFSNSDQQLFTAVRSLSYLKKLVLRSTKISPAGARNLTAVLPTLRNLTFIYFPEIQHHENKEFRKRFEEAARRIPGLDFKFW